MKLGRIVVDTPDGSILRLVAVVPEQDRVIDLATAERRRLERAGASPEAARRLALALFPSSTAAALALGDIFLSACRTVVSEANDLDSSPLKGVKWAPPVDPLVLRDFLAFEEHLQNSFGRMGVPIPQAYYEAPIYYKGNPSTIVAHEAEIPWPAGSTDLDYELELGFVVGRACHDVTPEEARGALFGVTALNDFSARDIQTREMTGLLGPAKGKDFATALGPWITSLDELDPHSLTMCARVNGEEWSRGSSATMTWGVEELVAYASRSEPLAPGEVLGSGTVGRGCGLELGRHLNPGDLVELEIQGVGTLRNVLGHPTPVRWAPTVRPRGSFEPDGASISPRARQDRFDTTENSIGAINGKV